MGPDPLPEELQEAKGYWGRGNPVPRLLNSFHFRIVLLLSI